MFDPDKGREAQDDAIDTASDTFAAQFEDLSPRKRLQFLDRANEVLEDEAKLDTFIAGNGGTPTADTNTTPAALGSGSAPSQPQPAPAVTDDQALQVIMASGNVPQGVKAAIVRLITPSDPRHMRVKDDGTPVEIESANNERDSAKTELRETKDPNKSGSLAHQLDEVQKELRETKDPNKSGSLAHQLQQAQANAIAPNGTVRKDEVKAKVREVSQAVANVTSRRTTTQVDGTAEVNAAVNELYQLVN